MAKALVQQAAGNTVADGGTLAYGSNVTAGNGLFALIAFPSNVSVVGITDTLGNTWALAPSAVGSNATSGRRVEVWYAHSPSGGANTLTFDWSGAANAQLNISEWSGFAGGVTVDAGDGKDNGSTTTHVCGATGVLTTADSLVLALLGFDSAFSVSVRDTGFNALTAGGLRSDMQYKIATGAATEQAATTTAAIENTGGAIASFSETAGGGGGTILPMMNELYYS